MSSSDVKNKYVSYNDHMPLEIQSLLNKHKRARL